MFRRLGLRKSIALAIVVALGLGYTPGSVYSSLASVMVQTVGSVAVAPKTADPIRDAVLNVTTDFDEVGGLQGEPGEGSVQMLTWAESMARAQPLPVC